MVGCITDEQGFAPGSWTQFAVQKVAPEGRVLGIDVLPCRPPSGASSMQGNFMSRSLQSRIQHYLADPENGRPTRDIDRIGAHEGFVSVNIPGYIDAERRQTHAIEGNEETQDQPKTVIDVVLSDMSAPWPMATGWSRISLLTAYHRLQNTSGLAARDHTSSMDLCDAALLFCVDSLKKGGHLVCKFYSGSEDKGLEHRLKRVFDRVLRVKPEASRKESRECYFVGLRKLDDVQREDVFR